MNRAFFLRRMRGPAIIITFGVTALLNQFNILNYGQSWPLYLLVIGGLMLAERAVWSQPPPPGANMPPGNPGLGYEDPGRRGPWSSPPPPPPPSSTALSITPPDGPRDLERR